MRLSEAEQAAVRKLDKNGHVDPVDLINAAKSTRHPCHHRFTWDVQQAAEERWRDQAREIIRSVKCQIFTDEEITTPVVEFISSPDEDATFVSLPKLRSKSDAGSMMRTEIAMLLGNCARVYGIALAKEKIVGSDVVSKLKSIRDQVATIKAGLEE